MSLIATTAELQALCARLSTAGFITVDTEFMRERTYWAQLCLIQIAGPDEATAIDPLAEDMDLTPLFDLLANPDVLKVFHAARQDIEIFYHLSGKIPTPLFDTQVAAMVCGFGDSVGYETLASRLAGARIDKSSRFSDWSNRPLTERQLAYALADVTHLRVVYDKLSRRMARTGRAHWLAEEMAVLTNPATYQVAPEDAWQRLKVRNANPRFRALLREVAAWREREAQARDVPRGRVLRDEALIEIAAQAPTNPTELGRLRGIGRGFADGRQGEEVLAAVARAKALPDDALPPSSREPDPPSGLAPLVDLLRVLLKMKSEQHNVANRLIASASDLDAIAADDDAPVPALSGWRREVFGADALDLKHGRLALAVSGTRLRLLPFPEVQEAVPPGGGAKGGDDPLDRRPEAGDPYLPARANTATGTSPTSTIASAAPDASANRSSDAS